MRHFNKNILNYYKYKFIKFIKSIVIYAKLPTKHYEKVWIIPIQRLMEGSPISFGNGYHLVHIIFKWCSILHTRPCWNTLNMTFQMTPTQDLSHFYEEDLLFIIFVLDFIFYQLCLGFETLACFVFVVCTVFSWTV